LPKVEYRPNGENSRKFTKIRKTFAKIHENSQKIRENSRQSGQPVSTAITQLRNRTGHKPTNFTVNVTVMSEAVVFRKEMPVIPVIMVVDKKRIIGKMEGREGGEAQGVADPPQKNQQVLLLRSML
jgi:hypothetical protein